MDIITGPGGYNAEWRGERYMFTVLRRDLNGIGWRCALVQPNGTYGIDYGVHSDGTPYESNRGPRITSRIDPVPVEPAADEPWMAGDECEWNGNTYKLVSIDDGYGDVWAWIVRIRGDYAGMRETVPLSSIRRPVKRREWTGGISGRELGYALVITVPDDASESEAEKALALCLDALNRAEEAK